MVANEVESRVAAHSSLVFRCSWSPNMVAGGEVIADYLDVEAAPRCRNNARSIMSILIRSKAAKVRRVGIGDVLSAAFCWLHVKGLITLDVGVSARLRRSSNAVSVASLLCPPSAEEGWLAAQELQRLRGVQ